MPMLWRVPGDTIDTCQSYQMGHAHSVDRIKLDTSSICTMLIVTDGTPFYCLHVDRIIQFQKIYTKCSQSAKCLAG